jgi:hypothetical protein
MGDALDAPATEGEVDVGWAFQNQISKFRILGK